MSFLQGEKGAGENDIPATECCLGTVGRRSEQQVEVGRAEGRQQGQRWGLES